MDKQTYIQLDRIEAKIDFLAKKLFPDDVKEETTDG